MSSCELNQLKSHETTNKLEQYSLSPPLSYLFIIEEYYYRKFKKMSYIYDQTYSYMRLIFQK